MRSGWYEILTRPPRIVAQKMYQAAKPICKVVPILGQGINPDMLPKRQ
jgi:hypothetical protein